MDKPERHKTVLVTGANGFIGHAVAKAFGTAGYTVYGLVRNEAAIPQLARDEIIPILGSPDKPAFIPSLQDLTKTFDVIVSTTEDFSDSERHFAAVKAMLVSLASESQANGVKPLVLFTSGCKDYGMGELASPETKPHTESSPLNPPAVLQPRTKMSTTLIQRSDIFDTVVTRPTTLFGGSSSYYGSAFELAAAAATSPNRRLRIPAPKLSIMHGTHVSDVAEAYVQIAESPRSKVAGKTYNISSRRYETAEEVATALVREYDLDGADFMDNTDPNPSKDAADTAPTDFVGMLFNFSQWVGSDKVREEVGWCDRRPLFTEALHVYRLAYEAAASEKHSNVERIKRLVEARSRT